MARRALRTDDEAGFLMAIHDELAELKLLFGVQIELLFMPASKRGHFHLVCYAYKVPRKPADEPYCSTSIPYPTAAATRLHAGVYRACIRIGGELSMKKQDEEVKGIAHTDDSR